MEGTRREAMALWGAALAVGATSPASALAAQMRPVPDRAMKLVRSIDHTFHDGARLSVFRSWAVEFRKAEGGIDLWGEEATVSVEGSSQLASMIEHERERSTAGLWPVRLSSSGLILAAGAGSVSDGGGEEAVGAAALDRLPDDLFYPSLGPIRSMQALALPGGAFGEFAVEYEARSVPGMGWLDRARRVVTTRVGNTRETAVERWVGTQDLALCHFDGFSWRKPRWRGQSSLLR